MAVTLSGLPCISPFDCIGEPATLAQRWDKWKAEFELYVAASGVEDKLQKRALLLHLAGPGIREIFKTYPDEVKGDAKEFDKAITCLSNHFEVKKNVPFARQKLLAMAKDCEVSRKHSCGKCGNRGHMEVCCRTKQDKQGKGRGDSRRRGNFRRKRDGVRKIGEQPEQSYEEGSNASEEDGYYVFIALDGESNTLPLMIENELVDVIIDSGATCNLMSEQVFDKVSQGKLELLNTDRKVYAYASQEPLMLSGKCMLNIGVPHTQTSFKTEFFVMLGYADTLLGRSSSEELGVLKVGVSVNACESRNSTDKKAALKTKYAKVFTGLGKLKKFQLKLHVDESVTPIAQAMRRIPFSRKQKVIDKLEELEALDVIEKLNGPTSWINPLVAVEKSNGDVRICLDMRQANQAILREKHPVSTIEETLQEMSGAKVFSKLDLNMAFHQIELAPESRDITTFAGPNGLYRYKRLLFGVNMATEKF